MSRKPPTEASFSAEHLRISNCVYDETVTVTVSHNGITVHLVGDVGKCVLDINEEDVVQIGCHLNEISCTLLLSVTEECVDRLECKLEMENPPEQSLLIIKLPSKSLSYALRSLQEIFSSKIIDLDELEYHDAMETYFECSDPKLLLYPPGKGMTLNRHDYKTLSIGKPLNDAIIDFFLRYLYEEQLTDDQQQRSYIFGICFFTRLLLSGYSGVSSWTRKAKLFDKDYIVVPMNQKNQWLLAIICFPSNSCVENSGPNKACILFFDSLATDPWDDVADTLREYLAHEYEANYHVTFDFNVANMPHYHVDVPQQDNQYDSGLFLMKFAKMFFKEPITDYTSLSALNEQLEDWFDADEIQSMRCNLSKLIAGLVKEHYPNQLPMPKIDVDVIDITVD